MTRPSLRHSRYAYWFVCLAGIVGYRCSSDPVSLKRLWFRQMAINTHVVEVLCLCESAEHCEMEKYVSDVRILHAEYQRLRNRLDAIAQLAKAT